MTEQMINNEGNGKEDQDFKYIVQDTGNLYLGARFSYGELLDHEMVPFKMKNIITHYLLKEVDPSVTLESHFYYMEPKNFASQTYHELKVKVKVSLPMEKKSIFGKNTVRYVDRIYSLEELEALNLAQKKKSSLIVREIIFPKMRLLSFVV